MCKERHVKAAMWDTIFFSTPAVHCRICDKNFHLNMKIAHLNSNYFKTFLCILVVKLGMEWLQASTILDFM